MDAVPIVVGLLVANIAIGLWLAQAGQEAQDEQAWCLFFCVVLLAVLAALVARPGFV